MESLIGPAVHPPRTTDREPINIHPEARDRLRKLLFEPEMRGVGYSEFVQRACEMAEQEIVERRRANTIPSTGLRFGDFGGVDIES